MQCHLNQASLFNYHVIVYHLKSKVMEAIDLQLAKCKLADGTFRGEIVSCSST